MAYQPDIENFAMLADKHSILVQRLRELNEIVQADAGLTEIANLNAEKAQVLKDLQTLESDVLDIHYGRPIYNELKDGGRFLNDISNPTAEVINLEGCSYLDHNSDYVTLASSLIFKHDNVVFNGSDDTTLNAEALNLARAMGRVSPYDIFGPTIVAASVTLAEEIDKSISYQPSTDVDDVVYFETIGLNELFKLNADHPCGISFWLKVDVGDLILDIDPALTVADSGIDLSTQKIGEATGWTFVSVRTAIPLDKSGGIYATPGAEFTIALPAVVNGGIKMGPRMGSVMPR